ncbi:uncharacterized protein LOC128138025 isoform X1 [Harpia harpyja]|uniref:uncharacterized protein LOC128138025 isoform X1 n=1 Tax=Harpia harpyja TaxID=202280 RepID=UPI0022B1E924|nr:uncharacterized protein LOC128138025 isoform X1 [Harpia harpyja]
MLLEEGRGWVAFMGYLSYQSYRLGREAKLGPGGGETTRFTSKLIFWWTEELREEQKPPDSSQNWYFGGWRSSGRTRWRRTHPIYLKIGILVAGGAQGGAETTQFTSKLVFWWLEELKRGAETTRFFSKLVFWWLEELREDQMEENPPDSPQNWYFGGWRSSERSRWRRTHPIHLKIGILVDGDFIAWIVIEVPPTRCAHGQTNRGVCSATSLVGSGGWVTPEAQMTTINIWGATAQPIPEKRLQPTPVERAEACRTVARAVTVVGPSYFRGSLVVKATKKNTTRPDATARTRNNPSSPR